LTEQKLKSFCQTRPHWAGKGMPILAKERGKKKMEISIFGFDPPPLKEISISLFLFFFLSLSQLINLCGVSKATYHVQGSNVIELTKYWLQYAGFNLNQSVG